MHFGRTRTCIFALQAAYLLYNQCAFPPRVTVMYLIYIVSLLLLFTDFDRKTYSEPAASAGKLKKKQ